jgi:hypothetical protein
VKGSRGGYGYAQWTGPRRRQFEAWAALKGLNPASYEANYGFLRHELDNTSEGNILSTLRKTNSAADAARVVSRDFLRPGVVHMESRVGRANDYLSSYKAGATAAPKYSGAGSTFRVTPPAVPSVPASTSRAVVAPNPGQAKVPPPPQFPVQIGSAKAGPEPLEVIMPQPLSQNLSDRGLAQLATGGMGGGGMGQRMA